MKINKLKAIGIKRILKQFACTVKWHFNSFLNPKLTLKPVYKNWHHRVE